MLRKPNKEVISSRAASAASKVFAEREIKPSRQTAAASALTQRGSKRSK